MRLTLKHLPVLASFQTASSARLHLGDAAIQVAPTAQYHYNSKAAQKPLLLITQLEWSFLPGLE